jgi:hypothetical protein
MKVIKDFITQSVTTLPLKRNLVPRFTKGRGSTRNDEESPMIDGNQGVHLVGSERYASTIKGNRAGT